ncbi:hypothetical protein HOP50_06g46150 [Chloropicon primus]|uniref:IQ domain-containing protein n=1 Tax=Chloropicon primus TaxID=1764295 RepID=A0A5B8MPU3_9CHLO|nr:hypothetical protein A3770_06p45920 [Chloropicon primus]UPR01293.1 hypothetical protein HOP50_06g46150 [Chloropicon primus]|eukprot:QDZ22074.1 hypothetical protein A3770_06p45920 [Chloropicon primus]
MEFQEFQFDDSVQYSVNLEEDETFQDWCARRIQAWYRGRKTRRQYMRMRIATILIQMRWRRALAIIRARPDLDENARIIQNGWKRYWYRKVFVYYKNLIDFRQRGTPLTLLKSINPAEAQLAEAAAGLHVRFRLGGSTFPPLIFYKIYTHRPVTDICSFAPRDYAEDKKPKPRILIGDDFAIPDELLECHFSLHEGSGAILRTTKRQELGWYLREDMNGWRPIAERLFYEEDPVERYTSAKRMDFSHIPKVRRETLNKKRREKKLQWMQRMYGMSSPQGSQFGKQSTSDGEHKPVAPPAQGSKDDGAYEDDMQVPDVDDLDDLMDNDDALIAWSSNLNFDEYYTDWIKQSCSNGSETVVPLPAAEYNKKATIDSFRSFERESFEREMA